MAEFCQILDILMVKAIHKSLIRPLHFSNSCLTPFKYVMYEKKRMDLRSLSRILKD